MVKVEGFDSYVLQKNIPPEVLGQIINDVMDNFGMKILKFYLSEYEKNGGLFVRTFIKCDSIQTACKWCIIYCLRQGLVIEPDEKVKKYVVNLKLDNNKAETLEKLLNIFKMIR